MVAHLPEHHTSHTISTMKAEALPEETRRTVQDSSTGPAVEIHRNCSTLECLVDQERDGEAQWRPARQAGMHFQKRETRKTGQISFTGPESAQQLQHSGFVMEHGRDGGKPVRGARLTFFRTVMAARALWD